jgi:putative addiction module component (TIGR02574 family)
MEVASVERDGAESMSATLDEIRRLSVTDRLKLINDVWETLLEEDPLPLSEAQAREIDRRLDAFRRDGDRGMAWEEFEEQLEAEGL